MSDKLRVHTLSKELGVTSKAILAKCESEGVEGVTNHMSTLSAGLAETIREWFSDAGAGTAVETAAPVDLEKVRKRRRPVRKKAQEAATADMGDSGGVATETLEPPEETITIEEPEPQVAEPEVPATAAEAAEVKVTEPALVEPETPGEEPPDQEQPEEVTPAMAPAATATPSPAPPVKPAGPQNVPAPAQMKGPKVVGFAKPDPIVRPVPRTPPRPSVPEGPLETVARRGGKGKVSDREEAERKSRQRGNPRRGGAVVTGTEVGERLKEWNDRDLLERQERLQAASGRGIHARRAREKRTGMGPAIIAPRKTRAQVKEPVVIHELCAATGIGQGQLFPKFKNEHNILIARNTIIPTDLAELVMLDFGVELEIIKPRTELDKLVEEFAARPRNNLRPRPPVVTMLGHVDHGKTSLLDAIRRTSVAEGEAGGITQHIGAYRVERDGLAVTFLDTPGHEAFTAMRARGANLTDVVVLVVAADDGLMPQTIEAINHAKAAKVTIVVALNKIDLPGTDINKIYGQLAELELTPTEWGGETDVVKTSAVSGEGVQELITHLAALSDLLDLKADPDLPPAGSVIEAEMKTGVGPVTRVLVREGTLRRGDTIVCGPAFGRVRLMRDDRGRQIQEAGPGVPVEVAGLDEVPTTGDSFHGVQSLQRAKEIADETKTLRRQSALSQVTKARTLDELFQQRETGALPEVNLILRADVQGSVDALLKTLGDLPVEEVKLNILHSGVGSITESDVVLAEASGALVVGFNVNMEPGAQRRGEAAGVDIRLYRIIYDLTADIRKALEGLLPREKTEETRGRAEVREIFHVSRVGTVAGCMVTEGPILRSHFVRIVRDGQIIVPTADDARRERHRSIHSLRRFKDDVREVRGAMECGIRIEDFDDVKPGDVIETYEVIETARKL